jgi:hypothetical protein
VAEAQAAGVADVDEDVQLSLERWPKTIGGRPSLAEVGQQLEGALRAIRELPNANLPGDFYGTVADEVRDLLWPKIAAACLGRVDPWIHQLFWGTPQGVSDRNCALLATAEPAANVSGTNGRRFWARWLRGRLRAHVSECHRQALLEVYAPRSAEELPFKPEPVEARGHVELGWPSREPNRGD